MLSVGFGIKLLLVLSILFIVYNLVRAAIRMISQDSGDDAQPMSHYLGRRVFISAALVLLLLLLLASGVITPNPRPY